MEGLRIGCVFCMMIIALLAVVFIVSATINFLQCPIYEGEYIIRIKDVWGKDLAAGYYKLIPLEKRVVYEEVAQGIRKE